MKTNLLIIIMIISSLTVFVTTVSAELVNTPEGVIITHYPNKFDGVGIVYNVEERGVVIDDMFVPFASRVRYMTPQSGYASLGSFKQGQKVGYILNEEKQITELCLFLNTGMSRSDN